MTNKFQLSEYVILDIKQNIDSNFKLMHHP